MVLLRWWNAKNKAGDNNQLVVISNVAGPLYNSSYAKSVEQSSGEVSRLQYGEDRSFK